MKLSRFAKYAWFTLAYNLIVIVWGVFLRASKSGDGCGQYWLTCHGEVIPSAPQLKTVIEFSHRVMSGLDFFVVLVLAIWAFRLFEKRGRIRLFASISFVFIITEALIGAGLVLTGNTAESLSQARPFWAIGHLINTFILLGFLSLTAWTASTGKGIRLSNRKKPLIGMIIAVCLLLLVGTSGSLAALSTTLFPVQSLMEGLKQDFSETSHFLLRLRLGHPILSVLTGVYLVLFAGWLKSQDPENRILEKFSGIMFWLVVAQLAFGFVTLMTLAPIVMQLGHLLLADLIWILLILMSAAYLCSEQEIEMNQAANHH